MTACARALLLAASVACSGGGSGGAVAPCQLDGSNCPLNLAVDTDGDGAPDFVHVAGDFDGNGTTNLADLQPAIAQLSDDGPKRVQLSGGPYDMSAIPDIAAWQALGAPHDPYAGIVLESETELVCDEGVVLRAWTEPSRVWSSSLGFRLVTNTARNDGEIDHHIVIRGCTIDYGWDTPYDGSLQRPLSGRRLRSAHARPLLLRRERVGVGTTSGPTKASSSPISRCRSRT